jgi:hypothetical protein
MQLSFYQRGPSAIALSLTILSSVTSAQATSFVDITYSTTGFSWMWFDPTFVFSWMQGRGGVLVDGVDSLSLRLQDGVAKAAPIGSLSFAVNPGQVPTDTYSFALTRDVTVQAGTQTDTHTIEQNGKLFIGASGDVTWFDATPVVFTLPAVGQITVTPRCEGYFYHQQMSLGSLGSAAETMEASFLFTATPDGGGTLMLLGIGLSAVAAVRCFRA